MNVSTRVTKVRSFRSSLEPRNAIDAAGNDDDDVGVFSGMQNSLLDVDAIERQVDAELTLLDPFATPTAIARATHDLETARNVPQHANDNDDRIVDAFMSHQPQYKRSVVAKKLQLYEKQLAQRDQQLAALRVAHDKALANVETLKQVIQTQQQEFDDAQDDWQDEKEQLVRFRGPSNNAATAGSLFQMKMGVSAAAMAARARMRNEADVQKQREMRLQMLRGAADVQDQLLEDDGSLGSLMSARGSSSGRLYKRLRRFVVRHFYPFSSDVRQIEARFGYSVASYFRFFRWIIMSFGTISIPSVVLLVLHVLVDTGRFFHFNWAAFDGVLPAYLMFPMYLPEEGTRYTLVLLIMQTILLLFTIRKWITEDRQSKATEAADAGTKQPKFGRVVLNAWDFTMTTREQASDLKKSIAEQIKVTLQEEELAETLRRRTRRERYILYARRATAFLLYLVIQAASWYLIIVVTTQSSQIQAYIALKATFLAPYVSSIVPAVVTLINGVLPTIISQLTTLEKWDDVGFAIKAMVTRLYLAKILNVLIQLVSYALLLDPYLFTGNQTVLEIFSFYGPTVRRNVMLAFKPDIYACRADQVASGLLTLVVTDFTVSKVIAISSPALAWITMKATTQWTRYRSRRALSKAVRVVPVVQPDELNSQTEKEEGSSRPSASNARETATVDELNPSAVATEGTTRKTSLLNSAEKDGSLPPAVLQKSEFQVPQKMVALLYSCTIALVAIPLAPSAAVLALLLHVINFKTDKLFLVYFQKKPMTPWSAKDAGSFFIKFYFCTVMIFIAFTHFFLANEHLPKSCSLQDVLLSDTGEQLCLPGSYDMTTELCSLNATVSRSSYFLVPSSEESANECVLGYPKCVCSRSLACGPFVDDRNGYDSLLRYALSVRFVAAVYKIVASSAFVAWGVVLAMAMGAFFLRNSLRVQAMMADTREHETTMTFASLRKKIKQLENRLRVHKISHEGTSGAEGDMTAR